MRNGSRGLKLDLGHKHSKNGSVDFPDFDEAGPQKDDFLWLSSDCRSPSMLSFDAGQDPFPFRCDTDGYSKEEEEAVVWLLDSDYASGACSSESGDSCCFTRSSLCDESSCTTPSAQEEDAATTACAGDLGSAADIWVSSLDLDVEDSEFGQCKEQGWFDIFGSDFPSPSIRSKQSLPELISSPHTENCDSNEEALFWPFDQKSYILRDFEKNFLCLSPRKHLRNVGGKGLERSKSISPGLASSTYRKITISPPPSLAASDKRSNRNTTRTTAAPSRLSRLHRAPSDEHDRSTISRKEKLLRKKTQISEPLLDLEMDIFRSLAAAAQGAAIEALVGLNEFDGHEGIGVDRDDGDGGDELVLD